MDDYYSTMKTKVGIKHSVVPVADEDNLEQMLTKIRPNSCAENFAHFLTKSQNQSKTTLWK